jgi:hypothetical protein
VTSFGYLSVGTVLVSAPEKGVSPLLLAVFRDDMLDRRMVPAADYYDSYVQVQPGEEVEILEFHAPGQVIADRLDALGLNRATTLASLNKLIELKADWTDLPELEHEHALWAELGGKGWIRRFREAPDDPSDSPPYAVGGRMWLLTELLELERWDERLALRACLLALPDEEVVLELTQLGAAGYLSDNPAILASDALEAAWASAAAHSPVVVLTEGSTDAEFLGTALHVLYPHLTDLVRFLDYQHSPEGGVDALIRMVRAFASAGIANPIVAVFDNDSAGCDALRRLNIAALPDNIRALCLPDIALAANYPTLGPPTGASPSPSLGNANVNGRAASLELYLGHDVLTGRNGSLRPVQWTSFLRSIRDYQGEVIDKAEIQKAFRAKARRALTDPSVIDGQDWEDLRTVLKSVLSAFHDRIGVHLSR